MPLFEKKQGIENGDVADVPKNSLPWIPFSPWSPYHFYLFCTIRESYYPSRQYQQKNKSANMRNREVLYERKNNC